MNNVTMGLTANDIVESHRRSANIFAFHFQVLPLTELGFRSAVLAAKPKTVDRTLKRSDR